MRFAIQIGVSGRHQLRPGISAQKCIYSAKKLTGRGECSALGINRKLYHRSNQCSWNAMPRNICDKKTGLPIVHHHHLVKIACYRGHRDVLGNYAEAGGRRYSGGENRSLNLARHCKLRLKIVKLAIAGERVARGSIAETAQKK